MYGQVQSNGLEDRLKRLFIDENSFHQQYSIGNRSVIDKDFLDSCRASVVANASTDCVVISGNSKSFQIENIIREGKCDVVHF
eukprot:gene14364-30573_t